MQASGNIMLYIVYFVIFNIFEWIRYFIKSKKNIFLIIFYIKSINLFNSGGKKHHMYWVVIQYKVCLLKYNNQIRKEHLFDL